MTKQSWTEEEKKEIVRGYNQERDGTIDDYSKQKKIATSQFYTWRKLFAAKSASKPRAAKLRVWHAPAGDKAIIQKLEVKNEILKEMLEDALTNKAA